VPGVYAVVLLDLSLSAGRYAPGERERTRGTILQVLLPRDPAHRSCCWVKSLGLPGWWGVSWLCGGWGWAV